MKKITTEEGIVKFFSQAKVKGDEIIFTTDPFETLSFVKENYNYSILKNIEAHYLTNGKIGIQYYLYNPDDKEFPIITFEIKDTIATMKELFENADIFEKELKERHLLK